MTTLRNQNYKLKYRPNYRAQQAKYKSIPPPMTGNPPEALNVNDWGKRCEIIYAHMMAIKKGMVPDFRRRGLWFHADP